jgi:hypothetical protein
MFEVAAIREVCAAIVIHNHPLNFFAKASILRAAQVTTAKKCEYSRQFARHLRYLS